MIPGLKFQGTERFSIRRKLGEGGMGVVYEALDRERDEVVALKVLRRFDARNVALFKREFRALADLAHSNLVRLGELYSEDETWFFTMELVDGVDFLSWVRPDDAKPRRITSKPDDTLASSDTMASEQGIATSETLGSSKSMATGETIGSGVTLASDDTMASGTVPAVEETAPTPKVVLNPSLATYDEARLRDAMRQLASAVAALHAGGTIHRDLKPSNVLVTPTGRVVLLDFGLVTETDDDYLTTDLGLVGTAAYMAPEQAATRRVGPEADWYAVGVMLYEALTGDLPFVGGLYQILKKKQEYEPPPPRAVIRDVPADLDSLCADLLRFEPESRPRADDVLERLGKRPSIPRLRHPRPTAGSTRSLPFVGRDNELGVLRDAFAETRQGRGVTVLVQGESGVGKSALVKRFGDDVRAAMSEVMVVMGRCYEREAVPYKALDGVMDTLTERLCRMDQAEAARLLGTDGRLVARLFPALRRVPALQEMDEPRIANPQQLRGRAFAAARAIFSRIAKRYSLVVIIDDLQWADADGLLLLNEILHPPNAPSMLALATVRTGTGRTLDEDSLEGEVRTLALSGIGAEAGAALARELLGSQGELSAEADALAREAAGHPLFIQELVRYVQTEGAGAAQIDLEQALWNRIARLEKAARRLLEVLAVAGSPIDENMAVSVAGIEGAHASRLVSLLRAAFLARTQGRRGSDVLEPYHDRVREAVLERLDPEMRRTHHARLARALELTGAGASDPVALVRHLEGAGDLERAAQRAIEAGDRALDAVAFDRAAGFFQKALDIGNYDPDERRRLHARLGTALANAGRGPEAAEAYLAAAEGAHEANRLEYRRLAAEQLLICGHTERGLEVIREVLDEVGMSLPKTPARAIAAILSYRALLRLRGLGWKERDPSTVSARDLQRLEAHNALALGLAFVETVRAMAFQARGLLMALRTGQTFHVARSLGTEAAYRCTRGASGRKGTERLLKELDDIVERSGNDPYLKAWALTSRGCADYLAGDWQICVGPLVEAEKLFRDMPGAMTFELNMVQVFLVLALWHMGRYTELKTRLPEYLRDAARRGDLFGETTLVRGCNDLWLALDEPQRAMKELAGTKWSPPETGFLHVQQWYDVRARGFLAIYTCECDDLDALWRALDDAAGSQLTFVQGVRVDCLWIRARLWLALPPPDRSHKALRQAERLSKKLRKEKVAYATAWGLLVHAGVLYRRGDRAGAIAALREAIPVCEAGQEFLCGAAAKRRLGELVGGSEGERMIEAADAYMTAESVVNPRRMARYIVPGLDGAPGQPALPAPR